VNETANNAEATLAHAISAAICYDQGDVSGAVQSYSAAIEAFPDQPFFYACRSLLNHQLGDEEGAFYDYQVAKRLDFNYHHFLEWKENEGEMAEAAELLELNDLLEAGSSDHQLYVNRAMLHVQHYCYQEAIDDFSSAFAIHDNVDYLISSAAIYLRMLRYDLALEDLNRAIGEKNLDALDAFLYRGKLYAAVHENTRAEQDLDFCIQHDPTNKLYYEERAGFHEKKGTLEKAIADYGRLVTLDPEDFFPYVMRADLYEKTDQIALAIADYDKAIALNPYYSDLYQYRSELRYKIGDKDGAALDKQKYEELENE
jgi:tetratricopeptide (TPR) repeat protein